jgi:hypothetical protein
VEAVKLWTRPSAPSWSSIPSLKLSKLGEKLGLTRHQGLAVVHALDLKSDPTCYREKRTPRGHIQFQGLSNIALDCARKALADGLDINGAVASYNAHVARQGRAGEGQPMNE